MTVRQRFISRGQRGFSLIELMIAMVLGLLVVAGASAVFLSNKQSYKTGEALSRVEEGSRISFELMARDIRGAALTGCGNSGRMANVIKNSATYWWANWASPVMGYGGTSADNNPAITTGTAPALHLTGTDSVVLLGADDVTYSAAANADGSSTAPFIVNESATLQTGDVIIICTAGGGAALQQATIAQISGTGGGGYLTGTAGASPGNCTTGLGYPTNCTTPNAFTFPLASTLIAKLKAVSWYLGKNPQGKSSLYRAILTNTAGAVSTQTQEMVRNVTAFQLAYHVAGSSDFVDAATVAANWSSVDAIRITITVEATDTHAGVSPKTISRATVSTVAIRNRVN